MSEEGQWDGFHTMGLLVFTNDWDEFNPLEFALCIMPFVMMMLCPNILNNFHFTTQMVTMHRLDMSYFGEHSRDLGFVKHLIADSIFVTELHWIDVQRANILGRRGKKTEATIIARTDAGSRNLEWNKVTQLQMKIEYSAYDDFLERKVIIEKTLTDIDAQLHNKVNEGYTVNVRYDPINPFMMEVDDDYFDLKKARTGCGRNCCYTLFTFIVAVMFVLIPYWILKAAGLRWYWIIIIVVLLPAVMLVISCVSCCVCCRNHDMIAWYKTRGIMKELRRRDQIGSPYTSRQHSNSRKEKDQYNLMQDEFR